MKPSEQDLVNNAHRRADMLLDGFLKPGVGDLAPSELVVLAQVFFAKAIALAEITDPATSKFISDQRAELVVKAIPELIVTLQAEMLLAITRARGGVRNATVESSLTANWLAARAGEQL